MKIQDDFHETYAVILEGYHSFCVWMDEKAEKWRSSKSIGIEAEAIDQIIDILHNPANNKNISA
ncbi:hypothetical protein [Pedobacter sp. SYP-B3415]|uniref:hypothetical protein n=1 Tax=Pedobacter sp. SYP-B3415 TaxID=2496641 RepID=UPI00101CADAB|nr:hypothetical protein [Pedobacter sp. SYP-B3415]